MFNPGDYVQSRLPLSDAETLPAHCYMSDAFFQRERERIFRPGWHFAGRADEIAEAGQYMVVETVAGSAIICRSKNGEIHGLVNACRHRGTRLKDKGGHCSSFVCPYHAWTYELDGTLRATPGFGDVDGFDRNDYGMHKLILENWDGFLFFSFNAEAEPFAQWTGNFSRTFEQYQAGKVRCTWRKTFKVKSNWKFLMENALEAYHTGTVHGASLGAQESRPIDSEGSWDGLYVMSDDGKSIATLPGETQALPFIEGLQGDALNGTFFTVIYPCTQIVFSQDCIWWQDIKPVNVDVSTVTIGGCFPQSSIEMDNFDALAEAFYERWSSATPEDNDIAEAQQRGHQSGTVFPGRYSLREHCVHALNNWVLDQVLD